MENTKIFTDLADGFRKRFNVTDKLDFNDMVKLVTPPKGHILLSPGKFKITSNDSKVGTATADGGSTISTPCFIANGWYTAEKKLMDDPADRKPFHLRMHWDVISTDGHSVNCGVNGWGGTNWVPEVGMNTVDDPSIPTGVLIDSGNSIAFKSNGGPCKTKINLATSYVEIIIEDN